MLLSRNMYLKLCFISKITLSLLSRDMTDSLNLSISQLSSSRFKSNLTPYSTTNPEKPNPSNTRSIFSEGLTPAPSFSLPDNHSWKPKVGPKPVLTTHSVLGARTVPGLSENTRYVIIL